MTSWHIDNALVLCPQPLMRNANALEIALGADNFGLVVDHTRIGFLACCWLDAARLGEAEFEVSTGFTDQQRLDFMEVTPQVITIEYRGLTKTGKPRFPSFIGVHFDEELEDAMAGVDEELEDYYEPRNNGC